MRSVRSDFAFLASASIPLSYKSYLLHRSQLCATKHGTSEKSLTLNSLPRPALIFITPNGFCTNHRQALRLAKEALDGGSSLVQIRDLHANEEDLLSITEVLLSAGLPPKSLSLNGLHPDRVRQLSPKLGVHIRENDISRLLDEVQRTMDLDAIISCSVHTVESALAAISGNALPSYMQVGTMYPTRSHPGKVPEGVSLLRQVRKSVGPSQTLIGIGGIKDENLAEVVKNGADGVAVISSISSSPNPRDTASQLLGICQSEYSRDSH